MNTIKAMQIPFFFFKAEWRGMSCSSIIFFISTLLNKKKKLGFALFYSAHD